VHSTLVAHSVPTVTSGCSGAQQTIQAGTAWSPQAEAAGYGLTSQWAAGNTGAGQSIALYELAAYRNSDITAYANCFGITPNVSTTTVDGGAGPFDPASGSEPTLDLQEIIAMSPGARVVVYLGPNDNIGPTDVFAQMAADDSASIISSSWGICESQSDQSAEATIFQQMVLQGQTLIAAAGDSGSADCYDSSNSLATSVLAVDDPASQPTVTGIGGLSVTSFSPFAASVWNDGIGTTVGSGGGFSQTFPTPTWQRAALVASGALSLSPTTCGASGDQTCRAVPDISVVGDPSRGFLFRYQGSWGGIGGTSIGSPLVASIVAVASQNCGVTTGFGNLNPQLYAMNTAGGGLIDITRGDNDSLGLGAYNATVGYDPASGLGTIDPTSFYSAICPLVASATNSTVSAPSNLTVHGAPDTLTVTARNFANAPMTTVTPSVTVSPATGLLVGGAVSLGAGRSTFAVSATQTGTDRKSVV
jgi:subtilase family serine protease